MKFKDENGIEKILTEDEAKRLVALQGKLKPSLRQWKEVKEEAKAKKVARTQSDTKDTRKTD